MKYRKKPILIDAFKYNGNLDNADCPNWIKDAFSKKKIFYCNKHNPVLYVDTAMGDVFVDIGDYIVKDEHGALSAYNGKVFERTYEPVEE